MQIVETWSISYERIAAFFSGTEGLRMDAEGYFSANECRVRLTSLPPREVGRFSFPQTLVEFDGPDRETEALHRRFVLQFISAGG